MIKGLFRVVVIVGAAAGAVHLWRKYEVTARVVAVADELLTRFVVGEQENAPQKIQDEAEFLAALRQQREDANVAGRS